MMFYHWTKRIKGKTPFNKQKKIWFNYLLYKLLFNYTSNQIRSDDIYLEGRGYTNLTILAVILYTFMSNTCPRPPLKSHEPFQIRTGTPLIDNEVLYQLS